MPKFMLSGYWQHTVEAKDEEEAEEKVAKIPLEKLDSYGVDETSDEEGEGEEEGEEE